MKASTIAKTAVFATIAGALTLGLAVPADAATGTMYGDPVAAAKWWRYQKYDDCVIMSSADVVGQMTGKEPSERAIIKVAQSTPSTVHPGPVYTKPGKRKSGDGTYFDDEPTLLAHYGIRAVSTDKDSGPTGMEAIERALAAGRKIIVGVNAEILWGEPVVDKTPAGQPDSNHAVVVIGVDTATGMVHLNDSGSEDGRDEQVPIAVFVQSWATSDNQMTVTA